MLQLHKTVRNCCPMSPNAPRAVVLSVLTRTSSPDWLDGQRHVAATTMDKAYRVVRPRPRGCKDWSPS